MEEHLVKVNGRVGLIGHNNGLGADTNWLEFWDGTQIITLSYSGLGKGPAEADLIAIAASMRTGSKP